MRVERRSDWPRRRRQVWRVPRPPETGSAPDWRPGRAMARGRCWAPRHSPRSAPGRRAARSRRSTYASLAGGEHQQCVIHASNNLPKQQASLRAGWEIAALPPPAGVVIILNAARTSNLATRMRASRHARPPSRQRSVRSIAGPAGSQVGRAILRWMSQAISRATRPARVIAIHRFVDMPLNCARCRSAFVLSAGEQELYALRGVTLRTTLCPACVRDRVYG